MVDCSLEKLTRAGSEAAARYVELSAGSCNLNMTTCVLWFEFVTERFSGLTAAARDVLSAMLAVRMAD